MKYVFVLLLLFTPPLFSQITRYPADTLTFNRFSILLGDWQLSRGDTIIAEHWMRAGDSLFTGNGFTVVGGDTVETETMHVELRANGIYFVPVGRLSPSGKQIDFQLFYFKRKAVFENYINDFPSVISYWQPRPGLLSASIEGNVKGVFTFIEFPYTAR